MDFKINMGELEDVLTSLHKMKACLETLDSVLVNVQDAVSKQKGKLVDALSMEFGAHRDDISRQQGTVTKLYTYLEKYVNDLKSIDSPTYRNRDMLIDARGLQKLAETQRDILDHAKSDVFRVPQPSIGTIPDDPDELWVMRHNQGLMEDLDDFLRQKLTQLQQNEGEAMHRISQDMRWLMEMDREHASKIEKDYRQYDRNKVRQIGASTRDSIFGFGKRAIESLKHPEKQLESIAMLMKNLKSDPSGTLGMMWNGIVESYLEPYKKGDAYGLASSTILFASLFGITKGINDLGKIKNLNTASVISNEANYGSKLHDFQKEMDKLPHSGFSSKIEDGVISTPKGERPSPGRYMTDVEIKKHLALFDDGAVKIQSKEAFESSQKYYGSDIGDPLTGTYVLPKNTVSAAINASGGNPRVLEKLLGLEPGYLGDSPILLNIEKVNNIRIPSGNESGAWQGYWLPGGFTDGGVPEAVIDQIKSTDYTVSKIYK
ncbi:hypothetical protein [Listeria newyorkensis]|uniref:hypothetical protein n=1 Tax=Listeria newyorkensis TaxID=1497681 RepID=UPI00051CD036|nr:hypothetical protein [Listeria newyorkensis]KGL44145.1 hypothetical protein EP58_06775 [Listeria newyorkensis]SQC57731.1 Uncharacterised protein [Listeria newyorkensis]